MNEKLLYALLGIVIALLLYQVFAPAALVDVEINENRESGDLIYCATGSLEDPPNRYVGSGSVPKGDESYC